MTRRSHLAAKPAKLVARTDGMEIAPKGSMTKTTKPTTQQTLEACEHCRKEYGGSRFRLEYLTSRLSDVLGREVTPAQAKAAVQAAAKESDLVGVSTNASNRLEVYCYTPAMRAAWAEADELAKVLGVKSRLDVHHYMREDGGAAGVTLDLDLMRALVARLRANGGGK